MFARFTYWHDLTLIHPADLARFHQLCGGLCFLCFAHVGESDGYMLVDIEGTRIRLKPEAFHLLPPPRYTKGQRVRTTNGTPRVGLIAEIGWHFNEQRHLY